MITATSRGTMDSYLVPRAGVRLALAPLVTDGELPAWTSIYGINDRGDMIGVGGPDFYYAEHSFLLVRER